MKQEQTEITSLHEEFTGQISRILHLHEQEMCCKSEKFKSFFDNQRHWMYPVLTHGLQKMMEALFFEEERYQSFLIELKEETNRLGSNFILQAPELLPTDVLVLNQNLYDHVMRACLTVMEGEMGVFTDKSLVMERLYLLFSTSDHGFLEGYLRLKDKQIVDLHQQKISMMGQMAAGMAHEIRNPLTSMKGLVQLIKEQLKTGNVDKQDILHYLDICGEQIDSLETLTTNFLLIARRQEQVKDNKLFLFQSVMEKIHVLARFYALQKNVRYDFGMPEVPISLKGDPSKLEQVCLNIIRNAMEAVTANGHVHLECTLKQLSGEVEIVCTDNGPGIPADVISHIWNPFFTTKKEGTGLGLAVSRQLIEEMGGAIRIDSPVNGGTVVIITLPVVT